MCVARDVGFAVVIGAVGGLGGWQLAAASTPELDIAASVAQARHAGRLLARPFGPTVHTGWEEWLYSVPGKRYASVLKVVNLRGTLPPPPTRPIH